MTRNYLFPARFKKLGWMLLIPFGVALILFGTELLKCKLELTVFAFIRQQIGETEFFKFIKNDVTDEIIFIGLIVSLLMISFSRENDEDEFITQLRANSLIWALLVSYAILIVGILFIYEFMFLYFLYINMILILVLYVVKFNLTLYKFRKSIKDEE